MSAHKLQGRCHCGNITVELELTRSPGLYSPRACDCDFCRKHGASYLSDPDGSLVLRIKDERNLVKYRQGSSLADFLLCGNCGVLAVVLYQDQEDLYATVNSKLIDGGGSFGQEMPVSPKTLSDREKAERWRSIWFADVHVDTVVR